MSKRFRYSKEEKHEILKQIELGSLLIEDVCQRYKIADTTEVGPSSNNALVFKTFNKAIQSIPNARPLFHSNRGYQYTSYGFRRKLETYGMEQSMSRVGKCIDNGPMENFWGILKAERYYLKYKYNTYEELKTI